MLLRLRTRTLVVWSLLLVLSFASAATASAPSPPSAVPIAIVQETTHTTLNGAPAITYRAWLALGADERAADGGGSEIICEDIAVGLDQSCSSGPTTLYSNLECWVTVLVTTRGHFESTCGNEFGALIFTCQYTLPAIIELMTGGIDGTPCAWTSVGDVMQGETAGVAGEATDVPVGHWQARLITYE